MKKSPLYLAVLLAAAAPRALRAGTVYWDSNADAPGAGAAPAGAWDTSAFWSTDPDGLLNPTATWIPGDAAVFSAGTDATGAFTVSGIATASGITVDEGTMTLSGTITLGAGPVNINAGATLITNSSLRVSTTAGSVYTLNGGTLETTNPGNAGSFIDTDSTIFLAAGGGTISFSGTVLNIINFVSPNPGTVISGPGSLTKTGTGVIAIATACTYGGSTIVNNGELRLRTATNRLPVTTAVTVNSPGILNINGSGQNQQIASLSGNGLVGTGSGTLTIDGAASTTFSGALKNIANAGASGVTTGNGRLVKNGAGVITFAGVNDINGSVTLNAGGITVDPGASLCGPIADVTVNGGVLTLNNASQFIENLAGAGGSIVLAPGHVLTSEPVASTTCAATISGGGGITRLNANATTRSLTLTGPNTYDGVTTVTKGIIAVGSATALGSTAGHTAVPATGGEVRFDGAAVNFTCSEAFQIAGTGASGGGAITIQNAAAPTLSGTVTLTGDATVTVSSSASATFSNPASFTSLADQNLTLAGGANPSGVKVISGTLNLGAGGLTKTQGGKWTLNGSSAYTGPTAITAGTLEVNGALTASVVTVSPGATLSGTGTLGAAVTVDTGAPGGTLAPGSSVGAMNFGSTLDLLAGSIYAVEIAGAANADKVNVTGALTANGTIKVTLSGYTPVAGNSFDIADAASITGTPTWDFTSAVLNPGLAWDTSQFSATGVISVVIDDPFISWASGFGLTEGKNGDDDKDGASNLLEFATNAIPNSGGSGARAYGRLHTLGAENVLTLTVAVRKSAVFAAAGSKQTATKDKVIYTVEASDDLLTWNTVVVTELNAADSASVQAALAPLPVLGADWEWHSFRTDNGATLDPRDMIRLSVAAQP